MGAHVVGDFPVLRVPAGSDRHQSTSVRDFVAIMLPAALFGVGAVLGGYVIARKTMVARRKKVNFLVETAPPREATASKPGTGPTYRNVSAKDGFSKLEGVSTLYELFSRSVEKFPSNPCLGYRPKVRTTIERRASNPLLPCHAMNKS